MNFKEDVATIITDWGTNVSIIRKTESYNDAGEATVSWITVTNAYVDIQPNIQVKQSTQEFGIEDVSSHIAYGYYDTLGVKLDIWAEDRIYDAVSGKSYDILSIKEFADSHFEIYCNYVKGSGGIVMTINQWQTTFKKNKYDGNGIDKTFNTTDKYVSGSTLVFIDGVLQEEGVGKDYTEDSGYSSITFASIIPADEKVEIRYIQDLS